MTDTRESNNAYVIIAIVALLVILGLVALMKPEDKSSTRLGRAVDEAAEGVDDAADELRPNRTPGQKIGNAIEDAGEDIQDAAD